jgi:glycosyltransferase involved in cell wall biosynthesis
LGENRLGQQVNMKICAIIPAFNESEAIASVIRGIKNFSVDAVVVDDGSVDETSLIAEKENAHVIRNFQRSGKGFSLKSGFDYALKQGYDLIFTIDADGQHDPRVIPLFIDKIKERGCSFVIGNRMDMPQGMPRVRIITNKIMSFIISAICKQHIPDTQCGYRLFTRDAIANINIKSHKFEIDSELLVKLARKHFQIESIPIKSIYADESSKIRPVRDTVRFIRFLLNMIVKK